MDANLAEVLKVTAYAGAAFGTITMVARHYFKSYVDRKGACTRYLNEQSRFNNEKFNCIKEILASDGYKEYQKKREALAKELIEKDPSVIRHNSFMLDYFNTTDDLENILDAILGYDPIKRLE